MARTSTATHCQGCLRVPLNAVYGKMSRSARAFSARALSVFTPKKPRAGDKADTTAAPSLEALMPFVAGFGIPAGAEAAASPEITGKTAHLIEHAGRILHRSAYNPDIFQLANGQYSQPEAMSLDENVRSLLEALVQHPHLQPGSALQRSFGLRTPPAQASGDRANPEGPLGTRFRLPEADAAPAMARFVRDRILPATATERGEAAGIQGTSAFTPHMALQLIA